MASVLYSSARAVSMEKTLLGEERLKRMMDGTSTEALKILSEVGFDTNVSGGNAEAVIEAETAKFTAFVKETAPDEKTAKFFLYPYDFKNAEALVKSKFLKTEPLISVCGEFDAKFLKEKIFTDDYSALPKYMGEALLKADKAFVDGTATGLKINALFVNALYQELFALKINDKRLKKILCEKTDMLNVSVSLRTRNYAEALKQYLPLGELNAVDLKSLCEADFDALRERFRFSDYKDEICAALNGIESGAGLKAFEKLSDGYAVKFIKKSGFDSEGAFPFIRYCFYKLADIANARIITVGLSGGLTQEEIFDRLREHYEG